MSERRVGNRPAAAAAEPGATACTSAPGGARSVRATPSFETYSQSSVMEAAFVHARKAKRWA